MGAKEPGAEWPMHAFDVAAFLQESAAAIWEQKMLGRIPEMYAPQAPIHIGGATVHGSRQLLDRAMQCLAAFPDLRVFVDDTLYVRRAAAYLTSLRWTAVARNSGPSVYGPATGRRVVVSGITTSRIEHGRFVAQWIELGDGDLAQQLGFDEVSALQRLWPEVAAPDFDTTIDHGAVERPDGDTYGGQPPQADAYAGDAPMDAGALVAAAAEAIWNRRQLGEIARFYASHYREWGPGGRIVFGRDELQANILALMGAFPDVQMHLDDVFWDDGPRTGCRASTRWTLLGTNTGPGPHGPPTGASLRLSGITISRIEGGQFVEGWTAYSELGLARRLIQGRPHRGDADAE